MYNLSPVSGIWCPYKDRTRSLDMGVWKRFGVIPSDVHESDNLIVKFNYDILQSQKSSLVNPDQSWSILIFKVNMALALVHFQLVWQLEVLLTYARLYINFRFFHFKVPVVQIFKIFFSQWLSIKIYEPMHMTRRGSCCDADRNNLGSRLKQPTIWTVAETELVS